MTRRLYFSIVVPAHNEEGYIGATLEHLAALDYPDQRYEVLVVENGSSDRTLDVARRFECGNVRVFASDARGVSAAKNAGAEQASPDGDWVVFLDADTLLKANFLTELESLLRNARTPLSVGTSSVRPIEGGRVARAWFAYYDLAHRLGKGSYAIQIARRSMLSLVRFDEALVMGEDTRFIKDACAQGDFFFLPTDTVLTSTRRFEQVGYWRLFLRWSVVAVLPPRLQRAFGYEIIR
ncbi:glycosyltransferase family 2 protein [Mycolicibacterium arenosum]|uniref:glycosyltransferase family 2 protein n=1 Tax=Mycolicibacterium arenosum TaxID=2952157 RepID=UPI0027E35E21|nr:glycosyltransferase [Mycolicibacterium sp. CAU 1645]